MVDRAGKKAIYLRLIHDISKECFTSVFPHVVKTNKRYFIFLIVTKTYFGEYHKRLHA